MNPINRDALRILSLTSSNVSAVEAVRTVVSIWWRDVPSKEALLSQVGGADDFSLIAEYEGGLVGFVLARLVYVGLPMSGVCLIHTIVVKPDYQEQGVGTLLIEKLQENCKAKGIGTVRALISVSNSRLLKYCEQLGFRPSTTLNFDITP